MTERVVKLNKGECIGEATEAEHLGDSEDSQCISKIKTERDPSNQKLPQHLQQLYEKSSKHLLEDQNQQLYSLLLEFSDVFAKDEFDLGSFSDIEHEIETGDARPIKQRMRRVPRCFENEEKGHLDKLESAGIIEPSNSEWASAPVLVRKRDGSIRWCIDYRKLRTVTKKDVYPLPLIDQCLDTLAGNQWFSKLDANSTYYQIRIKKSDRPKTAFTTKYGLFQFVRMSFGLCNAPGTYARVMNLVLRGLTWNIVLAFLDDILVMGKTFDDHLRNLRIVFESFRTYGLKLKPRKCDLFKEEVVFLGRKVDKTGISMGDEYVEAVRNWPTPTATKQVEQFLRFVNYHRNCISHFADVAYPLHKFTVRSHLNGRKQRKKLSCL
jgi:hypothetical protein